MATKSAAKSAKKKPAPRTKKPVRPDAIDFRDLMFAPSVGRAPKPVLWPDLRVSVKHQGDTSACTGFALSVVVEYLLRKARRDSAGAISPFMLYSMARRYDDIPGFKGDTGSSVRAGLKGWHKHGACFDRLWPKFDMPDAQTDPKKALDDWWLDAVRRPLGAYYRIDPKAIADMHVALNENGVLYVSAACHDRWEDGHRDKPTAVPTSFGKAGSGIYQIPYMNAADSPEGHAFAIVGYNEDGFLIQNSWGEAWGTRGLAILTYQDWLVNGWDCWVAQLGVSTTEHNTIARHTTLRVDQQKVSLSAEETLRNREIAPFVVNMANNGKLSNAGVFRTGEGDLDALVNVHLVQARERWGLKDKPLDVCIYAHGGLVGEKAAAACAAQWIPMLYEAQVFPVFLMWETDFLSTLKNRLTDLIKGVPRAVGAEGFAGWIERKWNQRLERLAAPIGSQFWGEMKQNAEAISKSADSGGRLLYTRFLKSAAKQQPVRFHLVGHSAGSIVHAHIVHELAALGEKFESVSFMAPAVTQGLFDKLVQPRIADATIMRYQQFNLTLQAEEDDDTCSPYKRSLLWLVSESFEDGVRTPILGMQKYFESYQAKLPGAVLHESPGPIARSSTHGGFDDDRETQKQVLKFIRGG